SANQMRSTVAMEMAEAGMEWAIGMLNSPYDINASCTLLDTTNISFRQKYVQSNWHSTSAPSTDVIPATTTYPGCKINGNTSTCSCPALPSSGSASATASLGTTVLPGFTVAFSTVRVAGATEDDKEAVRITVTGCTAQAGVCTPATVGNSDATATITSIVKIRPLLRAAPATPLTCGQSCIIGNAYKIKNQDVGTGGILVNAGTNIDANQDSNNFTSIPGQPGGNSFIDNDTSLKEIYDSDETCSQSKMFSSYFGSTIAQFADSPMTKTIPNCGSANTCGGLVDTAYDDGWRSFYFPDGFARNSSSGNLGSVNDPVTMVSASGFDINGNIHIYGMIFANKADFFDGGTGTADIHGALVTCGDYKNNGSGTLEYNSDVLKNVRRSTGVLVRVPGSWTDRCTASTAHPPVMTCN
ncbi:MAG: hypothetical protein PHT57_15630, partial [Rhodoferax sp.]|nr:hypothetical protein [Rhodoferax sp.]